MVGSVIKVLKNSLYLRLMVLNGMVWCQTTESLSYQNNVKEFDVNFKRTCSSEQDLVIITYNLPKPLEQRLYYYKRLFKLDFNVIFCHEDNFKLHLFSKTTLDHNKVVIHYRSSLCKRYDSFQFYSSS